MAEKRKKFYCFVDETGQDTNGHFFLVAVVIKESEKIEILEKQLLSLEKTSGKGIAKWRRTDLKAKKLYLEGLLNLKELFGSICYSSYENSKNYTPLVSLTIAKALLQKTPENRAVKIIIDGLNDKEKDIVRSELKKLKIRYENIRGMRDESSVFLRLSDAIAGFLREVWEKIPYTKDYLRTMEKQGVVSLV